VDGKRRFKSGRSDEKKMRENRAKIENSKKKREKAHPKAEGPIKLKLKAKLTQEGPGRGGTHRIFGSRKRKGNGPDGLLAQGGKGVGKKDKRGNTKG